MSLVRYDVIVIGGGPGGLAAAQGAREAGASSVLVLEREGTLRWEGGSLPVKRGNELFVPHGVEAYRCETEGNCRLLVCGVPEEG